MKILKIFAKLLIVLGLFMTLLASLIGFYGLFSAVRGIENADSTGIGVIAEGMSRAYFWGFVDLFGLAILVFGLLLALVASLMAKRAQ